MGSRRAMAHLTLNVTEGTDGCWLLRATVLFPACDVAPNTASVQSASGGV